MSEIPNYQSNSYQKKKEVSKDKNVEKVTQGAVVKRKKPLGKKVAEVFTGEDARSVGEHVLFEVALPAIKSLIADMASQGVERFLFGDSRRSPSRRGRSYVDYGRASETRPPSAPKSMSRRARANHEFDEIILETRGEAEDVLDRLGDLIDTYGLATVSDLYDLVGITGNFTDDAWGWVDLRSSAVRAVREGYLLEMPKPNPVD